MILAVHLTCTWCLSFLYTKILVNHLKSLFANLSNFILLEKKKTNQNTDMLKQLKRRVDYNLKNSLLFEVWKTDKITFYLLDQ